jgi:hypothetical protein
MRGELQATDGARAWGDGATGGRVPGVQPRGGIDELQSVGSGVSCGEGNLNEDRLQAMNRRFGVRGAALSRRSAGPDKGDGMIGLQACVITYWPGGPCW